METFSALLAFCVGNWPITAAIWCYLWSTPEPTVEQTMGTLVIWDAIALIMTSLLWSHANFPFGNPSGNRPQTETAITKTATNRNGYKPEWPQTQTTTDRIRRRPKLPQTVLVCGRFGLWPLGLGRFGLWTLWPETIHLFSVKWNIYARENWMVIISDDSPPHVRHQVVI